MHSLSILATMGPMLTESQGGWIKPQRTRTLSELHQLIALKRAELQALEQEASDLMGSAKLEAIVKIRNIMRAHQLSMNDILDGQASRRPMNGGSVQSQVPGDHGSAFMGEPGAPALMTAAAK